MIKSCYARFYMRNMCLRSCYGNFIDTTKNIMLWEIMLWKIMLGEVLLLQMKYFCSTFWKAIDMVIFSIYLSRYLDNF